VVRVPAQTAICPRTSAARRDHSVNASRLHKKAPDDAGALIYGRETCAEINTSRQATEV